MTDHATERGGMDARSLGLFGQIVSANVAAAEFTTNALLAAKDDEIDWARQRSWDER